MIDRFIIFFNFENNHDQIRIFIFFYWKDKISFIDMEEFYS